MQLSVFLFAILFAIAFGIAVPLLHSQTTEEVPAAPVLSRLLARAGTRGFSCGGPANFTADTPNKDTVNAFLHEFWGCDRTASGRFRQSRRLLLPV